jgi:hypothetical protein
MPSNIVGKSTESAESDSKISSSVFPSSEGRVIASWSVEIRRPEVKTAKSSAKIRFFSVRTLELSKLW